MNTMKLGVNIDHVATLRQARMTSYPDPVLAARLAHKAGADNITCHLREDRRHIQDRDVLRLKKEIELPLNFEMAATSEMVAFAKELSPHMVTIVPERREELTTEGGLDVFKNRKTLERYISDLRQTSIGEISLFIDPDIETIELCKKLGADSIEIHTGRYCETLDQNNAELELKKIAVAATHAKSLGLWVHAGHGINYENVSEIKSIPVIHSLQIGHAIVARSVYVGIENAVKQMRQLIL